MCKKQREPFSNLQTNELSVENVKRVLDNFNPEEPISFKPSHILIPLPIEIYDWMDKHKDNYNGLKTMIDFADALADFNIEQAHKMKLFSDCSGSCSQCYTYYLGGCLAGHGDDMFNPLPPDIDMKRLKLMKKARDKRERKRLKKAIPKIIKNAKLFGECFRKTREKIKYGNNSKLV